MTAEPFRMDNCQHEETAEVRPCDVESSCKAQVFDAATQTAWMKDRDECLLLLRDVA